jgi:four helix bundle protein
VTSEAKTSSYKDLLVWQKGIALVKEIYQITGAFPADERFGLVSQLRRAAVSVPSNLAEGQARHTTGEFIQGVSYTEGSIAELERQLIIAIELGYCTRSRATQAFDMLEELHRMLNALRRKLLARQ